MTIAVAIVDKSSPVIAGSSRRVGREMVIMGSGFLSGAFMAVAYHGTGLHPNLITVRCCERTPRNCAIPDRVDCRPVIPTIRRPVRRASGARFDGRRLRSALAGMLSVPLLA